MEAYKSIKFQIFGKVQKVFFRKCTQEYANSIGLVGWVQNTTRATVIGEAQGPASDISKMQENLAQNEGLSQVSHYQGKLRGKKYQLIRVQRI